MSELQRGLVLVIDDVEGNRLLAKAYLERLGWKVSTAIDGLDALKYVARVLPEAMLIDVRMPGLDGDSLVKVLRQQPHTARIRMVAYTAHCLPDEVAGFLACGFDDVLIKPALLADMGRVLPSPANRT